MSCKDCIYHMVTHYNGTPADELYDECEWHCTVLHEDEIEKGCDYFAEEEEE